MAKLLKDIIQDKVESSIFDPNKIIADFKAQTGYELMYDGGYGFRYEGQTLNLRRTYTISLPDNLTVGADLELYGTPIASLPNNLTVGGYLDIRRTHITELPDNLTVGGNLYIRGTKITELPDNLIVKGKILKDF